MVLEAVSMDEKMDSSSDSSGFARAVSIMNRDSVTPVSEQTSEKMGAVGATRSSVAACVLCCFVVCVCAGRGGAARSRRTNAVLFLTSRFCDQVRRRGAAQLLPLNTTTSRVGCVL